MLFNGGYCHTGVDGGCVVLDTGCLMVDGGCSMVYN